MVKQAKDEYAWIVLYQDGTRTHEFDRPDGLGWAEIEEKPVKAIWLVKPGPHVDYGHHVSIPNGATPIFFRRRSVTFHPGNESSQQEIIAHCIGWKRGEETIYLFIKNNGSTLLTDDLQAV